MRYISHQLRTPLQTISVGIQFLEINLKKYQKFLSRSDELHHQRIDYKNQEMMLTDFSHYLIEFEELIKDISSCCSSVVLILDDLLLYDQIETGNILLKLERVLFMDYLTRWVKLYQFQAKQNGLNFQFIDRTNCPAKMKQMNERESGPDSELGIFLSIDILKVEQVIRNLLSNAIKFTSNGSITVTVSVVGDDHIYNSLTNRHKVEEKV